MKSLVPFRFFMLSAFLVYREKAFDSSLLAQRISDSYLSMPPPSVGQNSACGGLV